MTEASHWMTTEEFLALSENDEVERWLLRGKPIERPATLRDYPQNRTEARIAHFPV